MNILVEPELEDYKESEKYQCGSNQKSKSLWKTIAKNEIKIRTSSFRKHRGLFFVGLYSILLLWAICEFKIIYCL